MQFMNLKSFLQEAGLDPEHTSTPIRAEASNRKYFRITPLNPGNGPASVILCAGLETPYNDNDHFIELSEFLRTNKLPAPRVIALDRDQGRMLLTDAGEQDLSDVLQAASDQAKEGLIQQTIDLMIDMQTLTPPPVVAARSFDAEKLRAECEFLFVALRSICEEHGLIDPVPFELRMFLNELCATLGKAEPRVFAHRDFHTRNIMARPRDAGDARHSYELTLIDFQDARLGLPYYDLASLLYDPYAPFTLKNRQMGLSYFRAKSRLDPLPGPGLYYAQALQRILKALGTYLHQVHQKGHRGYVASIPAALDRVEEICQLGRFPDSVFLFARAVQRDIYPTLASRVKNSREPG
ncbi:MAG: phosphotransferase [Leptospirales bacterium]|jgi:aminoglycoside/choline kinase family phosphotransferase